MAVTVGELKGYWKKVADAVSSNKMNVTDTDILTALLSIGQTIEDVEAEIQAIKSTDGIKKIADAVKVTADDNTIAGLGALAAAAVTDPAASASVIALLKGMLKQLQGTGTGAAPVQLTGSNLQEQLTEADAISGVLTFTETIGEIEIYNRDAVNDGTFIVNGISIIVPKGEAFQAKIGGTPSANVTVSGSTSYIVGRYA